MTFSVILATRDREPLLAQTLEALAAQQWPRGDFEIVVADNGSTDRTRAVVEAAARRAGAPSIRYLYVGEPGKSHAVNRALTYATGELLAFTDDDVIPQPDWLKRLSLAFAETGVDFVAGRILPHWESEPPSWMSQALYGVLAIPDNGEAREPIEAANGPRIIPIGANMAVRAAVVQRLGGLRVDLGKLAGTLRTGEDHEFCLRMLHGGCRGIYEPTAAVHHRVGRERLKPGYFRKWLYQNGRDVARLEASYPSRTPRLLGVPRYLWREAAGNVSRAIIGAVGGDRARAFACALLALRFCGYVRETWFDGSRANRNPEMERSRSREAGVEAANIR
jgi:glycosyltransferase involved in cell wall biosynthesis